MANTTDILISCFAGEDEIVEAISISTRVDILKISNDFASGGPKILALEAYGACYHSLGEAKITEIIAAFKEADFKFPHLAVLTIDDDNGVFSGVILRQPK